MRAITFISKSKPANQVTGMAIRLKTAVKEVSLAIAGAVVGAVENK